MQQGLLQLGDAFGHLGAGGDGASESFIQGQGQGSALSGRAGSYPFVERVPLEVGALQVVLQRLGVRVFGGTLNQALPHSVDMLQLRLNAVHLLPLHSLKQRESSSFAAFYGHLFLKNKK